MNDSSRQASIPAALPGSYAPATSHPPSMGPGPGPGPSAFLGQEAWMGTPPHLASPYPVMAGPCPPDFPLSDSVRPGLFPGGFNSGPGPQGFLHPSNTLDPRGQSPTLFGKVSNAPHFSSPFPSGVPFTSPHMAFHPSASNYQNNNFSKNEGVPPRSSSSDIPTTTSSQDNPPEGLSARLLDKSPTSRSNENVPTSNPPSREGTPSGNVGYRPWEQVGGAEFPSSQPGTPGVQDSGQRPSSAQSDIQSSNTSAQGTHESDRVTFHSADYLQKGQKANEQNIERIGTPNRPPSHMSSGLSPVDSGERPPAQPEGPELNDPGDRDKLQNMAPHLQVLGPPGTNPMSSTHMSRANPPYNNNMPYSGGTPPFMHLTGHPQQIPYMGPHLGTGFPDSKQLKMEPDSSTADLRGNAENTFQVPSVSSTTSRPGVSAMATLSLPNEHWEGMNSAVAAGLPTNQDPEKVPKKKRKRCGECPGCLKKDNCGECGPCKSVRSHQICKMRKCDQLKTKKEKVSAAKKESQTPPIRSTGVEGDRSINGNQSYPGEPGSDPQHRGYPSEYGLGGPPKSGLPGHNSGMNQMFDTQYTFPTQNPQIATYNGHLLPIDRVNMTPNIMTEEGLGDFGPSRHQVMNSRLKSMIQNRQSQKEQGHTITAGPFHNQHPVPSHSPSGQTFLNQHPSGSVGGIHTYDHSSSFLSQPAVHQSLSSTSEQMRGLSHTPPADLAALWSRGPSPLQQSQMTASDNSGDISQFQKGDPKNERAFSTGESITEFHQNNETGPDQSISYLEEHQDTSNGMNFGAFYGQSNTRRENENSTVEQLYRSDDQKHNVTIQESSTISEKFSAQPIEQQNLNNQFIHPSSSSSSTGPFASMVTSQSSMPTVSSPYTMSSGNQVANCTTVLSPESSPPIGSEQVPTSYATSSSSSPRVFENASEGRQTEVNNANASTPTGSVGCGTNTDESMESQPFLLNTTTSMNTFTSIINTFNLASSPISYTVSSISTALPPVSIFSSGHSVIVSASSTSPELKSSQFQSHSTPNITSPLTGGGQLVSDIDGGRIRGSYGPDFFASTIGLPPSLSSPTKANLAATALSSVPVSSSVALLGGSPNPILFPLPSLQDQGWWGHLERLKTSATKMEVPPSDCYGNEDHSSSPTLATLPASL